MCIAKWTKSVKEANERDKPVIVDRLYCTLQCTLKFKVCDGEFNVESLIERRFGDDFSECAAGVSQNLNDKAI